MRPKGFTLIELLIVIGVIAIVSTSVVAGYSQYRRTSQLDVTAQKIVSTLRDAQSRSIAAKEGGKYGVHFQVNAGADEYMLFKGENYAGGTVLETFEVPSILGLTTINFAGDTGVDVVFDRLTGTTPNYGSVVVNLTGTSNEREISVNSEGRIGEYNLTETGFPGSFNLDTPPDGDIVTTTTPTFTWDPASAATSYTLWHSIDPNYTSYTEVTGITAHPTNPSYTLGGGEELQNQSRNYWKVKAVGPGGERWSEEKDWYVNVGINDPPDPFALVSPDDGADENTTLTPTFDWEDTTDPNGSPITYTLEHSTNSSFPIGSTTSVTGISLSEYTLKPAEELNNHTAIYWRVIAEDELGMQTVCSDGYRTLNVDVNIAPAAFNLLSPTDGGYVNTTTPTLDWEDAIDPDPGDTVTYTVWYSTDPTFSTKDEVSGITNSNYTIAVSLAEGTTYYWRVKAEDDEGAATWANQTDWDFYTNRPPDSFDLVSPADGSSQTGATVAFDWNDTTDPDVGDTVTYTIQVDNDIGFGSPEIDVSGLTNSDYTASGLVNDTYYWRVEAVDNHGYGRLSNQTWTFTYSSQDCDWHVDQAAAGGGDGLSWATAFQTIGDAVSAMSGSDNVCIANGNYNEDTNLSSSLSGNPGDYTEFTNKVGDTNVVINASSYGFRLNGADYVEINGLKIRGADENIRLQSGAENNVFTNLELYDGDYGIRVQSSTNEGNRFSDLVIHDNADYGVLDRDGEDNIYRSCEVYDNGDYGFYIRQAELIQVYDCSISGNNRALYFRDNEGTSFHDNRVDSNSSYNYFYRPEGAEYYNNQITNSGSWAMYIYGAEDISVHNNLFANSNYNIYSYLSDTGTHIYNNTIYGSGSGYGLYLYQFAGYTKVRNNIITNNAYGFVVGNGSSDLDNDYADVWGNTNDYWWQGAAYAGANSISQDPLFVNPGSDFRLQATSPCIDRGDPDPFYNDPDGSRSDIGALPYTP